ncbi:hypothetical protein ROV86_10375 [Stenotrophomonas pavanii]|uniref:hypothetical protein n=1 Tax=Stenotrophomonas maltophilia group TaxID=995085 RepID=UPI002895D471|nr:hypothetical protein [Stenotrophomonas pavanii]MDT3528510.1 hypothetical protein [Stenotrophomonas pavanii]
MKDVELGIEEGMDTTFQELAGADAEELLVSQIGQHAGGIRGVLASFEVGSATSAWIETWRGIEEFINIPMFGLEDENVVYQLRAIRLDDPKWLLAHRLQIKTMLLAELAPPVVDRYLRTLTMIAVVGDGIRMRGFPCGEQLRSVDGAVDYLQSRRRQMLALLYCMPGYCKGAQRVEQLDALNQFLPIVEMSCVGLTTLYRKLLLAKMHDDFVLTAGPTMCHGNYSFDTLDKLYLEPDRLSMTEVQGDKIDSGKLQGRLSLPKGQIFSAAELCNDLMTMEAMYAEFALGTTEFSPMARFIVACSERTQDNYHIRISQSELNSLMDLCALSTTARRELVYAGASFEEAVNSFAPFIAVGGNALTTVTLLSRFALKWATVCLNRVKRFQIRAGFNFETLVRNALDDQGFNIQQVKRIQCQEFDVIALKDGVIYNVQCKNNLLDLARMEQNQKLFLRYNRSLDRSYAKALEKDEARQHLLLDKFGLSSVKHVVVSKFPLATKNPRVMTYREINEFGARFA